MIGNASNRTSFAKNIKTVLDKYQLDGLTWILNGHILLTNLRITV